jgi:hypothetical protein
LAERASDELRDDCDVAREEKGGDVSDEAEVGPGPHRPT